MSAPNTPVLGGLRGRRDFEIPMKQGPKTDPGPRSKPSHSFDDGPSLEELLGVPIRKWPTSDELDLEFRSGRFGRTTPGRQLGLSHSTPTLPPLGEQEKIKYHAALTSTMNIHPSTLTPRKPRWRPNGNSFETDETKAVGTGEEFVKVAAAARAKEDLATNEVTTVEGMKAMWRKAHLLSSVNESMRKPRLLDHAPKGRKVSQMVTVAADTFDRQYRTNCARAERLYYSDVMKRGDTAKVDEIFDRAVFDVCSTRFLQPLEEVIEKESSSHGSTYKRSALRHVLKLGNGSSVVARPFDIMRTIWAPRAKFADSKSVYDTDEAILARFRAEWNRALELGVVKVVLSHDDDGAADEDGDGIP